MRSLQLPNRAIAAPHTPHTTASSSAYEFGQLRPQLTLILDNATRWNSAFSAIERGLRLREPLKLYIATDSELHDADKLTEEDWANLEDLYHGLKPFWETTQRLQGHGTGGSHGFIWEVLPAFTMLLNSVETKLQKLRALFVP